MVLSSSASTCTSSGSILPMASSALASAFSMKMVNIPDTTAATSSASVYLPSCFKLSMTGARNGTPLRCPILSRFIMWSTFLLPVFCPYASTLCQLMSLYAYDNGWWFAMWYAITSPDLSTSTPPTILLSMVSQSSGLQSLSASISCTRRSYGWFIRGLTGNTARQSPEISQFIKANCCNS